MPKKKRESLVKLTDRYRKLGRHSLYFIGARRLMEQSSTFQELWRLWISMPRNSDLSVEVVKRLVDKAPTEDALRILLSCAPLASESERIIKAKMQLLHPVTA